MARASFLLRPRWILSHVLVILAVVVMIRLGFWQLDRLDQRRDRNELITDRQVEAVVPVEALLAPGDEDAAVDAVRFRAVTATGEYDDAGTIMVRNRTLDGAPGVWLVTPLVLPGGDEVGVLRGFVAMGSTGDPEQIAPPGGEVTIEGVVLDPAGLDGTAPQDLAALLEADAGTILPGLVLAQASAPAEAAAATGLHPVPLPDLEDGPHLAYAVQWFIFATIAVVGYPLVLRRVVQNQGTGERRLDDAVADGAAAASKVRSNGEAEEILQSGG